jgi:hypothetical protein
VMALFGVVACRGEAARQEEREGAGAVLEERRSRGSGASVSWWHWTCRAGQGRCWKWGRCRGECRARAGQGGGILCCTAAARRGSSRALAHGGRRSRRWGGSGAAVGQRR